MSDEHETRRTRILAKIAASQARLKPETTELAPVRRPLPDEYPPEDYRTLAAQYPWLVVAGGLAAGALIGSLLPKSFGQKFTSRAIGAAGIAAELGLAFSKQARTVATDAARDGVAKLDENTAEFRQRASGKARVAASTARSTGLLIAREAVKLAARARR